MSKVVIFYKLDEVSYESHDYDYTERFWVAFNEPQEMTDEEIQLLREGSKHDVIVAGVFGPEERSAAITAAKEARRKKEEAAKKTRETRERKRKEREAAKLKKKREEELALLERLKDKYGDGGETDE